MRPLQRLVNYKDAATGRDGAQNQSVVISGVEGPATVIPQIFAYQSFLDSTALQKAILTQNPNEPIVKSTLTSTSIPGYAVGLHPSSQTPIAFRVLPGSGQRMEGQVVWLKPGEVWRPIGKPGAGASAFAGVQWGLPFGWLGGGLAHLVIMQSPDAYAYWPTNTEIIFHRLRQQIVAPGSVSATPPSNWPMRFPWPQAQRLTSGQTFNQFGQAICGVTPTRVELRLRLTSLGAAASMRALWFNTVDFDLNESGSPATFDTPASFDDRVWQTFTNLGAAGVGATSFPIMDITGGPWNRIAAGDTPDFTVTPGGLVLVDGSGGAASLATAFVDIVRYGTLG